MRSLKVILPVVAASAVLLVAALANRRQPSIQPPARTPAPALPTPSAAPSPVLPTAAPGDLAAPEPRQSLQERLARAEALPLSAARTRKLWELAAEWARVDPQAAAAWTRTLPRGWTYTNPDGSVTSETVQGLFRELVAGVWASNDPAAAAAWVEALAVEEPRTFKVSIAAVVAAEWVKRNSLEAVAWALRVNQENRGFSVLGSVFEAWARVNPREAAEWLERHPAVPDRSQIVHQFAHEWARTRPRDAAGWAMSLGSDERPKLLLTIASMWSIDHPEDAAAWVAALPPADQSDALLRQIGESLASRKPELAARWADHFPEGPQRAAVLLATVTSWAQYEPQSAIAFLQELPSEPRRNEMMLQVGRRFLKDVPGAAPDLLRQMRMPAGPFEGRSEPFLELLFEKWSKVDPEAAVAWAKEASTQPAGRSLKHALQAFR